MPRKKKKSPEASKKAKKEIEIEEIGAEEAEGKTSLKPDAVSEDVIVEKGKAKEDTDIFEDMLDDIHDDSPEEVVDEEEKEIIKEQGTKEEDVLREKRDEIKETILQKATLLGGRDKEQKGGILLKFLEDEKEPNVFIGRKRSVHKKYGYEAAFLIGKVNEEEHKDKSVFLDGLNPHVVFVCGARGSGKCLTGDTLITLQDGRIIPIKELENENTKIFGLNHALKVEALGKQGFFRRTVNKILKVKLRSGKEINLTPEHPLLTVEGWKQAQELSKGSRIATPRVLPAFGNVRTTDAEVKLLAYLIAEGHLSNHFVLFSNTDKKIQNEFFENVYAFDQNLKIKEHSKPNCFRVSAVKKEVDISNVVRNKKGQFTSDGFIVAQKNSLAKWIESFGLYGKLSTQKFIPSEFLQLNKEQLSLFLSRLFSCDGTIHRVNKGKSWSVSYASSSKQLITQVQNLLLRFGVLSKLRTKIIKRDGKAFKGFEIVIYGESVLKYIAEIGFFAAKEKKQEIAFLEMSGLKRNPNTDTVPKEIWNRFKVGSWTKLGRAIGYSSPKSLHNTVKYAPSREKLLRLAQLEQNKGVELLAQSDVFWDEIIENTEITGEVEVFDVSVPVYHNFVANDIIVHNSYFLGVIAEELATKNKNLGAIIVDPIGVFWSMRFPNKEEKEIERLEEWGLKPKGLDNLKVFIPKGMIPHVPESTFDSGFSLQPSMLESEDWALTFGIDRFSVTGLLLEKVLKKVEDGFTETETKKKIAGKKRAYAVDDIIHCLERDNEINSREKGFKADSIRALVSRFEATKAWGIFDEKGTPLSELSRANQLTILDTSFLDDTVTALVVGIIARRLLAARKLSTRKEAAQKFKSINVEQLLELEVPPTWLVVDEAHTLIPSGNVSTPASKALVEYVKQGRRPGCSLVFATQQPSAIDTKVLSQLDVILVHKLVFDDDIKAVYKRTPTIIPGRYKKSSFVKTLPVGVALTGDRQEETSRAFVMRIRPRHSQHEGRDTESTGPSKNVTKKQVLDLAIELVEKDISEKGFIEKDRLKQLVETLNSKYSTGLLPQDISAELEKHGFVSKGQKIIQSLSEEVAAKVEGPLESLEEELEGEDEEDEPLTDHEKLTIDAADKAVEKIAEGLKQTPQKISSPEVFGQTGENTELISLPLRVGEKSARRILDSRRKKRTLGLFGQEELFDSLHLKNHAIWKVEYDVITRAGKEFISRNCFVDSVTGEFVHFSGDTFVHSNGLRHFFELSDEALVVMRSLQKRKLSLAQLSKETGIEEGTVHRTLKKLAEKNLLARIIEKGESFYTLKDELDVPPSEVHPLLNSLNELPFSKMQAVELEKEKFSKGEVSKSLSRLWKNIVVKRVSEVYRPVWTGVFSLNGKQRAIQLDAVTGKVIKE